jgi:tRNA pseudouridine55 synthase
VSIDGILNVHKPPGKTSFQLVSFVRRLSGERRVGHGGTLDPYATGVLPIFLGQGTRVVEFLTDASKTYRAQIELGATTDTYDATGTVLDKRDPSSVTDTQVREALASFRGTVKQVPPMYSAIKHQGQPLYRLARQGISLPREPRAVQIYRLEMTGWQPPRVILEIDCGSGTYIRSLAHDLGQKLGCGAFVRELVRLRVGPFHISQAVPLSTLQDAFDGGFWTDLIHPIDEILLDWAAVIVEDQDEDAIRNGRPVDLKGSHASRTPQSPRGSWCRAYSSEGHFLAILEWRSDTGLWHTAKVFCAGRRCSCGCSGTCHPHQSESS